MMKPYRCKPKAKYYRTVFDTETKPETGVVVGIALSWVDAEYKRRVETFDTVKEFFDFYFRLIRKAYKLGNKDLVSRLKTLWAHNGNNFDFLLLYEAFDDDFILENCKPIMNDMRLIGMDIKVKGPGMIRLRDTWRLLPSSLKKLCENFKPEHYKLNDVDSKYAWRLKETDPDTFWEYVTNDVLSLQEILLKFEYILSESLEYTDDLTMTTPGLAKRIFCMMFEEDFELWTPNNKHQIEYEKAAYHGGLTLALRTGAYENVSGYDVNSMYPYVMSINEFPDHYTVAWDTTVDVNHCGIWKVEYKSKDKKYPPFIFDETGSASYNGLAYVTSAEYTRMIALGYIVNVLDGFSYVSQSNIFKKYIDIIYGIRKQAKQDGNEPLAEAMKLLMNSLYGKFAEKSEKTKIYSITGELLEKTVDQEQYRVIGDFIIETFVEQPKHQFYGIAVHVTAHARIYLHTIMQRLTDQGIKVLYCDTDSVYYQGEPLFENTLELGGVKLEFRGTMTIAGKKLYSLDGNIKKVKAKGIGRAIKQGALTHETFVKLMNGERVSLTFETLPSPREVLFQGKKAAKSQVMTRTIRMMQGVYDE